MTKGRFEGLTDTQWLMITPLLPKGPEQRGKGHPHTPWRPVCNTILWVLITGSRWCDVPKERTVGFPFCRAQVVRKMVGGGNIRPLAQPALFEKFDDFSVHSLQNFFSMCKHMAKKFCKEWTKKRKFIKKMRLRKRSIEQVAASSA